MTHTPLYLYQERIKSGDLHPDSVQEHAMIVLHRLYEKIIEDVAKPKPSLLSRIAGFGADTPPVKGVYMYGGVGRGKSMLMDLFYDALPDDLPKRRVHFHEFMIEVHDYINTRSVNETGHGMVDQALPSLADLIATQSRILCFDEFHVVDITDAMILGRLFKILFEHDVIVVATSNWAPDDLYKGGLQRERFLPFIALLKSRVESVFLDSPHDYRAKTEQIEGTYFTPLGSAAKLKMDKVFEQLIGDAPVKKDVVKVKGRTIDVDQVAGKTARFSFAQLCERPHGAEDYLKIAQKYDTVLIEGIPRLGYDRRNEAKRLMNLIDALYEARTRVVISADEPPHKLYFGDDHAYEFERTVSRLLEMQSENYP